MASPLNPYTATREEFTANLLSHEIPTNANAKWKSYAETSQALLRTLAQHEAMVPNMQQTYMTPAASKNKIYFMWDFVGRTLGMYLYAIPPTNAETSATKKMWEDVVSRTVMAKSLLNSPQQNELNMIVEMSWPDSRGEHPDLGDDVRAAAAALP